MHRRKKTSKINAKNAEGNLPALTHSRNTKNIYVSNRKRMKRKEKKRTYMEQTDATAKKEKCT